MNRNILSYSLLIIFSLLISACGTGLGSKSLLTLPAEPVSYKPEQPERWVLPNGLTIAFLPSDELPLVGGFLAFRGGGIWEPLSDVGVTGALSAQMREGGAGSRSPEQLNIELEKLAAEIGTHFGDEYGWTKFFCLSRDLETVFAMFADVVMRPRFDEEKLNLWKSNSIDNINRRREDPGVVAQLSFRSLMYGEDTVFGRTAVESDIKKINRDDLFKAHKRLVQPEGSILAINGDVDRQQVQNLVEKYFGSWRREGEKLPPPPWVPHKAKPAIYYVNLPFQQSTIYMGHVGVPRFTEDFIAIDGFNQLFGAGGFSNRLMEQVRTNLGLAYMTYGAISPRLVPGSNTIGVQTKAESTGKAMLESMRVLKNMQDEPVKDVDLASMKREIENAHVFNFDSDWAILWRSVMLDIMNYPKDYDETYLNTLNSLTKEDIQAVARDRWDLSNFIIVVVGNEFALKSVRDILAEKPDLLNGYEVQEVQFDQRLKGVS